MEINRDNYEAFLLDLLEGRLSAEERQRLNDFLLLNPDCADELTEVDPWVLENEKVGFRNKAKLKKELPGTETTLTDHNFDLFSIARLEGDLTLEQERAHQSVLETDAEKAGDWLIWQRTRLVPPQILYKGKENLKHKNGSNYRILWMSLVSAAAAITLLLLLFRTGPDLLRTEQAAGPQQSDTSQRPNENPVLTETQTDVDRDGLTARNQTDEDRVSRTVRTTVPVDRTPVQNVGVPVEDMPEDKRSSSEDPESTGIEVPSEELPVHHVRVTSARLNAFSPAGVPVPDEIKSLDVPALPVHLSSLSVAQISDMGLMNAIEEYSEERNFSLWNVASAGINGINKLARSDISLMASRDEEGEISGFQLKGKRFSITRPIGQDE